MEQGKPILSLSFIKKGILKVSDILNDTGNFCLGICVDLSATYVAKTLFASWIALIELIPQMWK